MPDPRTQTQATSTQRVAITIPANSAPGETIRSLLVAGGLAVASRVVGVKILARVVAGTDRGAFLVADADLFTVAQHVAAGADYNEPAIQDANSYVRSTVAGTVPAIAVVYLDNTSESFSL